MGGRGQNLIHGIGVYSEEVVLGSDFTLLIPRLGSFPTVTQWGPVIFWLDHTPPFRLIMAASSTRLDKSLDCDQVPSDINSPTRTITRSTGKEYSRLLGPLCKGMALFRLTSRESVSAVLLRLAALVCGLLCTVGWFASLGVLDRESEESQAQISSFTIMM